MKRKPLLRMALVVFFLLIWIPACSAPENQAPTISLTPSKPSVYVSENVGSYLAVAPA